ncbi:hypothetical protein VSS74_26605 [Conexibacter stalactiti]|uniref:Uncharacterized protein n=1 Tax=Conexibacter stalactiti TaxID=1940611 RepID=A0ABU4HXR2_9ACTN|nr:hypothetical protein [Conexibacter stalactiti]MDW5597954.1 hypothetical protein [Conexibacter stalactiti]MEC5038596.1 hypothetical protein [Conexibacter stalactiti]
MSASAPRAGRATQRSRSVASEPGASPARGPLAVVAPQLWRNLPLMAGIGLLALAGALLAAGAALSGAAIVLAPALLAVTVAPAWFAACALADPVLDGRVVGAARVRAAFALGFRRGPVVALPALVPAQLAAVALAAIDASEQGALVLTASLAANLVVLGCALIVAPFALAAAAGAFAAPGEAPAGVRDVWRIGAGIAATLPLLVLGGIAVAVLGVLLARALGPVLLVVVPGPAALVVVACAREQLAARGVLR